MRVAAAAKEGDAAIHATMRHPSIVSGVIAAWGGAIAIANAETLVLVIYGNQFGPAVAQVQVLIPGVVALAVARPLLGALQGLERLRPALIVVFSAGGISIVGSALAVGPLGPGSVAFVTSSAYFCTAAGLWLVGRSRNSVSLSRADLGVIVLVFASTLAGAYLATEIPVSRVLDVLLSASAGTVASITVLTGLWLSRRRHTSAGNDMGAPTPPAGR